MLAPKKVKLSFDQAYYQNEDWPDVRYRRVSQVLGKIMGEFDEDAIAEYLPKAIAEGIIKSKYENMNKEEILKDWEKSRTMGTRMHKMLEILLSDIIVLTHGEEALPNHVLFNVAAKEAFRRKTWSPQTWDWAVILPLYFGERDERYPFEKDEQVSEIRAFREFLLDHPDYMPILLEERMTSSETPIGGCCDAVFKDKEGRYVLCDYKRSKKIWMIWENWGKMGTVPCTEHLGSTNCTKYFVQLCFYSYLLERTRCLKVYKSFILNLHPNAFDDPKTYIPVHPKKSYGKYELPPNFYEEWFYESPQDSKILNYVKTPEFQKLFESDDLLYERLLKESQEKEKVGPKKSKPKPEELKIGDSKSTKSQQENSSNKRRRKEESENHDVPSKRPKLRENDDRLLSNDKIETK
jgi:hypothetical protein